MTKDKSFPYLLNKEYDHVKMSSLSLNGQQVETFSDTDPFKMKIGEKE